MPTKSNGAEIRRLREEKGWSGREFALMIGFDPAHLWKIENGLLDGSAKARLAIARGLEVQVSQFTYFEKPKSAAKAAA